MRTLLPDARPTRRQSTILASMTLALGLLASSSGCMALGLRVESSSPGCGAALVVFGVRANVLTELASGPYVGAPFRWLNAVGAADLDGDGRLDINSVTTPHIGGVLTLHHYRPPSLEPYAKALDVSNHRMGALEQRLAAIVELPGHRPTVIVPDMQLRALHALRWEAPGQWKELAELKPMAASIERLSPAPGGACALLADGSWWRASLLP